MTEDCQNLTLCPVRDEEPVGMLLRKQDHRERGKDRDMIFMQVSFTPTPQIQLYNLTLQP